MGRQEGSVVFMVTLLGAGGGGGGLWNGDGVVAAGGGVIVSGKAQQGCYAHHAKQKKNGASRAAGIAAIVDEGDGLWGWDVGERVREPGSRPSNLIQMPA